MSDIAESKYRTHDTVLQTLVRQMSVRQLFVGQQILVRQMSVGQTSVGQTLDRQTFVRKTLVEQILLGQSFGQKKNQIRCPIKKQKHFTQASSNNHITKLAI